MSSNERIIPPLKIQGGKVKLVSWIEEKVQNIDYERWVEPFMGSGAVAFGIRPQKALLCDNNPYIIKLYKDIQDKKITGDFLLDF